MICERTRERSAFILFSFRKPIWETETGWLSVILRIKSSRKIFPFSSLRSAFISFPIHFYLHSNGWQVTRSALVSCTVNKISTTLNENDNEFKDFEQAKAGLSPRAVRQKSSTEQKRKSFSSLCAAWDLN